jgi:Family of unknown function (DUF5681)
MRRKGQSYRGKKSTSNRAAHDPVGYGQPPLASRFKPGTSGNPNGRPKKCRNAKTIIRRVLDSTVTIREGDRTRTVSKLEGIILRQVEGALKGDPKAALAALRIMAQVGLLDSREMVDDRPQLSPAEQAIVDELFEKKSNRGQRS